MGLICWVIISAAFAVNQKFLIFDGHNDLPWRLAEKQDFALTTDLLKNQPLLHTDIPKLQSGGLGAQFWSAYVPASTMQTKTAYKDTLTQIDLIQRLVKKYPTTFEIALSSADVDRIYKSGKIASLIGVEGGHSIEDSLAKLRDLYARGVRYMTLAHSANLSWIESATDKPMKDPLTAFGKEVVAEMNRLGMFVDISHISSNAMREVMKIVKAPVIASHSSAYALRQHPRNVPDDVLKLVGTNGGVIMVNFYPVFLSDEEEAASPGFYKGIPQPHCRDETLALWIRSNKVPVADTARVVDHIDHIVKTAGVDHVGLGSDFDGIPLVPEGLEDVSKFPALISELEKRGYGEKEIRKILGGNVMRAMAEMEKRRQQSILSRNLGKQHLAFTNPI